MAALVAAMVLAATATATPHHKRLPHQPFKAMTLHQLDGWLHRQQAHDRGSIRWLTRHIDDLDRARYVRVTLDVHIWIPTDTPVVQAARVRKWKADLEWFQRSLKIVTLNRVKVQARIVATSIPAGVCGSCWDNVADCESHQNWGEVTGNGFYWGLQWVPSTWDGTAPRHGLPLFKWFAEHHTSPTREQQITAASDMALSNWPVCQARYY